ncbi:MAG: hypothetical protein CMI54_04050 [Parcubacteria group bacterium]|nr:hypothetical protein [Parcubacteria group bacterium]|tara:strand:+ start:3766 stop:6315 length:2550 start_codon:yes stop_codon:yes gene_type:complete
MAENVLGRIILDAGNQARGITGGGAPPISGLLEGDAPSGGGGSADSTKEASGRRFQKGIEAFNKKSLEFAKAQPRWFTSLFKKVGIQMGLAGILKQSQIFTSTIGSLFQIFGAFIDVMLAPLIRPLILPILRWLARRIPDVSRAFKQFWHFTGVVLQGIGRGIKTLFSKDFWTQTVFGGLISFFEDTLPGKLTSAFSHTFDFAKNLGGWIKDGVVSALKWMYENTFGRIHFKIGSEGSLIHWEYRFPQWGGDGSNLGSKPRGETSFKEIDMNDTGAGSLLGMKNDKLLNTFDKAGKLLSTEDLTTIEGSLFLNPKVEQFLKDKGVETTREVVERSNVTHQGSEDARKEFDAGSVSWWKKIFNPNEWLSVFGDFKQEFKNFWSGSAISNVLKGAGVVVGGSLGVNVTNKLVSGMGSVMKGIMWTPKQLVDLLNATLKTPGMMGLNTAKWAVSQLNLSKGAPSIIGTVRELGLKEGAVDLVRRAMSTMGSGVSNAVKDAWTRVTAPVRLTRRAVSATANIASRGRFGTAWANTADDAARAAMNSFDDAADLVPRKSPQIFDPSIKKSTPTGPTRPVYTGPDTVSKANRIQNVMKKVSDFGDAIKSFIRGAGSWTLDTIKTKAAKIATLGDQAFALAKGEGMVDVLGKLRLLKSFAGRLVPFAATGIAIATTGKNIADIANMEHLSWWQPHKGIMEEKLRPILDAMEETRKQMDEGSLLDKVFGGFALGAQSEMLSSQALAQYVLGTKGGAIGTQTLMGAADALLGFGGAITLPLQAGIMGAQFAHMQGVKGYNAEAGTWTGTLDELMAVTDMKMDAATMQLAIEQGMSNALKNSTVNGKIDLNGTSFVEFQ